MPVHIIRNDMKKIILLAAAVVLSASLNTAAAGKKKEKKQKNAVTAVDQQAAAEENAVVCETLPIVTTADSLSFAAGKTATQGLIPYLQQQLNVDTAYMEDFVRGYVETLAKGKDVKFTAYQAGMQIAKMAMDRILPSMRNDFEGSDLTISEGLFHQGFVAALQHDNQVLTDSAAQSYFDSTRKNVKETLAAAYKAENAAWLTENAKKEGVVTLPDGLQYKVLTMGEGEKPLKEQTVEVKYEGKLIDGTVFDSSYKRNPQTAKFRCDQVIKGWTEALQLMPVGSKWELYIPQELAYGERQAGQIKPFSTLIFTVELVDIVKEEPKADNKSAEKLPVGKLPAGKKDSVKLQKK